jgi:elongation factor G
MDARPQVETGKIRTVVLLGAAGAGKTALAEALLAAGEERVRPGLLDSDPDERERGHTLSLAVASMTWKGHRINLIDTPGSPDALGDAFPALHAADVAVFVVDAVGGWQAVHDQLWAACEALSLPRLIFLAGLDRDRAGFQAHLDLLRERYGKPLAPVHMPIGVERDFGGVIDLLHLVAVTRRDGGRVETEVPAERRAQAERNRETLVEAIVEVDDELLLSYLEGEVPTVAELAECFEHGVARCDFFPVLCGSPPLDIGTRLLADFLIEECPSLDERREVDGPASVVVFKTRSDPYVGHISLMRVLSGSLRPDATLGNARTGHPVRLNRIFALQGPEQIPVTGVSAGDLVAAAKLDDVQTGDVLMADGALATPLDLGVPRGYHRAAIATRSAKDEERLPEALRRLREEDPSLGMEVDEATRQLVLVGYGPGHVQTALTRLERRYAVGVDEVPRRLRYRETITEPAAGRGRHVKQTGGSGQYGIAEIEVEPLPRGSGFEFIDEIVGGVIPRQYIGSVEKGVQLAMERGVLAGYPCVDVRVRLLDGKSHRVDSSQVAFEMAGAAAFRDAAQKAAPVLLEPIMRVEVTVPDAYTGDVMGDLSARRGRIEGTRQLPPGRTAVSALVPEAELITYVGDLRGLTQGQGVLTMVHDHHAPLPAHLQPLGSEPASPATH